MGIKLISLAATALVLSTSVNAAVIKTLDGTEYTFLELSVTRGLSRNQVEAQIAAATPGDTFYGFEYATRSLTESLLLSYSTWDGVTGTHTNPGVPAGIETFLYEFGNTYTHDAGLQENAESVDGDAFTWNQQIAAEFFYGRKPECNGESCRANISLFTYDDAAVGAWQLAHMGWDSTYENVSTSSSGWAHSYVGSLLVASPNPVPVPGAVWLFGSGLLGLIGFARRKKA